jgi:hypothetical protein
MLRAESREGRGVIDVSLDRLFLGAREGKGGRGKKDRMKKSGGVGLLLRLSRSAREGWC